MPDLLKISPATCSRNFFHLLPIHYWYDFCIVKERLRMLQLRQKMGLHQRMTPQQVQYLKLLQTPAAELEAKIKEELDDNPLLEEVSEEEQQQTDQNEVTTPIAESAEQVATEAGLQIPEQAERTNDYTLE